MHNMQRITRLRSEKSKVVGKIYVVILSVNSPTEKCFYVGSGLELRKNIVS